MTKEQTLLEIHQILVNLATTTKIFAQVYKDTRFLQLKEALDGDLALMQDLISQQPSKSPLREAKSVSHFLDKADEQAENPLTPTDQLDKLWREE